MALSIRKVGVIGAGQMGNGIAHVVSLAGFQVALNDLSAARIKEGLATINGNMARQVSKKIITENDRQAALGRDHVARVALAPLRLVAAAGGRRQETRHH